MSIITVCTLSDNLCRRPEQVAEAILQLATDSSKAGAVMTVTMKRGIDFFLFPGDPGYSSKKSKL